VGVSAPFDLDIIIFFLSMWNVVFGSKNRLRQNSRPVPVRFELELLAEEQLSPALRAYLQPMDAQLLAMNYRPLCTFRAKNFGANLLRRYFNPADASSCGLTIVEVKVNVNGIHGVKNSSAADFTARLPENKLLITNNSPSKTIFDQPAYRITQKFPNLTNLSALKQKHDERLKTLGIPGSPPQTTEGVFEEFQAEHDRYSRFQLERGVYRLSADSTFYLATDKVFERGIRNHFLPLGKRVSITQVIFTALVGAFLPLLGILKIAPWIEASSLRGTFPLISIGWLAIAACYVLAGFIMGYFCDTQKFAWIMLVTYVPAHLVAGWTFGWLPYSTLAFNTAYFAGQSRRRRGLVLQT
jgi:hypothetical protein